LTAENATGITSLNFNIILTAQ